MARDESSTPPSLLSRLVQMAGLPSPPIFGLWRAWSQAGSLSPRMRCAGLFVEVVPHRKIPRAVDPRNTQRTDLDEVCVAVEPIYRPGAAISVAVDGGLVV